MKTQIKNLPRVIAGIAFFVVLLFITAFKEIEIMAQAKNTSIAHTGPKSLHIDIRILIATDKVEALRKLITSWPEVRE
jgi:hypothetical protein